MNNGVLPKVLVIMGTFNGQEFLETQVESIFEQVGVSISLLVRDDGSVDKTIEILDALAKKFNFEYQVGTNLGFSQNYICLIRSAIQRDWDYLAFADQDDLWNKEKLTRALESLTSGPYEMYSSKRKLFSDQNESRKIFPNGSVFPSFINSCFENICPGCTIVITKKFAHKVIDYLDVPATVAIPYDSLLYSLAVDRSELYFDTSSYIDYRIHLQNTIGINQNSIFASPNRVETFKQQLTDRVKFFLSPDSPITTPEHLYQLRLLFESRFSPSKVAQIFLLPKLRQNPVQNFFFKLYIATFGSSLNLLEN